MQQIYTGRDGQQYGPYTKEQIISMIQGGQIIATDSAWYEGLPEWHPITSFPDFAPYFPPAPAAQPTPNPALSTRLGRKLQRQQQPQLASRGIRLLAVILDTIVLLLPGTILGLTDPTLLDTELVEGAPSLDLSSGGAQIAIAAVISIFVTQAVMLSLRGQTIGKWICRIRILRTDYQRAGFVHAFLIRTFCNNLISGIPIVGLLYAITDVCFIFRADRRCIHDLMAGTVVMKV